ncbi:hypothetical protein AX769_20670 [Frondihabitans sp. PAMC 28766]|uniref:hypothetical protein n=1 Tax=Frondihabitans sp. PAMC 28766 TaxID=1795630 RepID=UPI00078CF04B|nr:hypothetical protein [Frondihabitans sp. PAMC 28766]AMM22119.1 hypothetical protein AX769_20670 [Frondihabitans sp. PAMC 28766]
MILWLASIVVAVVGYLLMITFNSKEAAIYVSGKADYPKLFAYTSGSTIGGLLIAVGVLGALLALVSMAITWRPAAPVVAADPASAGLDVDRDADDDDSDDDQTLAAPLAPGVSGPAATSR